jgi:hypothetical protein
MGAVAEKILIEGLPLQTQARRYALRILIPTEPAWLLDFIRRVVKSEWSMEGTPSPWAEFAAITAIALFWLSVLAEAQKLLEAHVF